jgi:hypothetical protein
VDELLKKDLFTGGKFGSIIDRNMHSAVLTRGDG